MRRNGKDDRRRPVPMRSVVALPGLRMALAMDALGLTLLVAGGVYLAIVGAIPATTDMVRGLQLVMLASLIGCVVTADKAVMQFRRTVVMDILGAGTWALAVVLTPVAMIQRLSDMAGSVMPVQVAMLVWLSLHGAMGVALAAVALRWRKARTLNWLRQWQRWLAVTGVVALAFPYLLVWVGA